MYWKCFKKIILLITIKFYSFKDLPAAAFYSSPNIYQNQNKNPYDLINNVNTIYRASNESPSVEEFCILRENRVDENTERKNNQNENENENINNNNIAQAELREPINSNQPVYEKPCDNSNCDNMTDNGSTLCTECFKNDTTGINTIFNCCQQ